MVIMGDLQAIKHHRRQPRHYTVYLREHAPNVGSADYEMLAQRFGIAPTQGALGGKTLCIQNSTTSLTMLGGAYESRVYRCKEGLLVVKFRLVGLVRHRQKLGTKIERAEYG